MNTMEATVAGHECKSCGHEYTPWDHGAGNVERFASGMDRAAGRVDIFREAMERFGRNHPPISVDQALAHAASLIREAAKYEREAFLNKQAGRATIGDDE